MNNFRLAIACVLGISTPTFASETKGPVTDELRVIEIKSGDPIEIGGIWALTGDAAAIGLDQRRGAELYLDKLGQKILGHDIKFNVEDGVCTAEGGQTAATKLANNPQLVAVLGPECSSTAGAAAPILWNQGISMVATAASSPTLTAEDRPATLQGFVRTFFNDNAQGQADAQYIHDVVACNKLATIHDGSSYSENLTKVIQDHFKSLGGEIVAAEAVEPTTVDMRPVLTSIAAKQPCALFYGTFIPASAQIVRQAKEVRGLENVPQFGGGSLLASDYLQAAGAAAVGMKLLIADTSPEAFGKEYPDFLSAYKEKYGEDPIAAYHAQAYDGAHMLHLALESVAKTDGDGNLYIGLKALRNAYENLPEFAGLAGAVKCDKMGDCAKLHFAVYEYIDDDASTFNVGVNPKKIYTK